MPNTYLGKLISHHLPVTKLFIIKSRNFSCHLIFSTNSLFSEYIFTVNLYIYTIHFLIIIQFYIYICMDRQWAAAYTKHNETSMASSATPSTLTLSYTIPQDFNSSSSPSLSFKPKPLFFNSPKPFIFHSLIFKCKDRKLSNWVGEKKSFVVSAVAEVDVEEVLEDGVVENGASSAPVTKPKKGKAALLLKRDRVCVWIFIVMGFFICVIYFDLIDGFSSICD